MDRPMLAAPRAGPVRLRLGVRVKVFTGDTPSAPPVDVQFALRTTFAFKQPERAVVPRDVPPSAGPEAGSGR